MHWYVIYTKPQQERRALINLERQGYECYLPMLTSEKLRRNAVTTAEEPLFPRYLFIHLDPKGTGQSWAPIRSTKGVNRMVTFGKDPAKVDDRLIGILRARSLTSASKPKKLFTAGERLLITDGSFAGIEAIYQMSDGESRAMVLIELLSKPVKLAMAPSNLRKIN